ncbi:YnbE family lipoprotein [Shewanella maritima]|uniref:YnbE family lipoprotein n=1 Tax=Shewanella maritima TaxID=2520507 RepID=UPI0037366738
MKSISILSTVLSSIFMLGCTPTVNVAPPEEPIEINLNVKIEHEVTISVEEQAKPLINDE